MYEERLEFLVKDYTLNQGLSIAAAVNRLLLEIQSSLESMGKTLEGVGLPLPEFVETEIARQQALFDPTDCQQLYDNSVQKLNAEQLKFIEAVRTRRTNQEGGLLFLNGAAGKWYIFLSQSYAQINTVYYNHITIILITLYRSR